MASAQVVNWLAMRVRTLERRIQAFEFEKAKCDAIMEAGFGAENGGEAEKFVAEVETNNAKVVSADGKVEKYKDEVEPNNAKFVTAGGKAEKYKEDVELNAAKCVTADGKAEHLKEDVELNTAKFETTDGEAEEHKEVSQATYVHAGNAPQHFPGDAVPQSSDVELNTAKLESEDVEEEADKRKRKRRKKKKPEDKFETDDGIEADKPIEVEQHERSTEEALRELEMSAVEFANMSGEEIGDRVRKAAEHEFECEVSYDTMGALKETFLDMLDDEFASEEEVEKALLLHMKKKPGALRTFLMKKMRQKTEFCGVTVAKHDIDGESVS